MIPANHNRRGKLTGADHFVEGEAQLVTYTQTNPANTRGQALERDTLAGHVEPVVQVLVLGQDFFDLGIRFVDVLWIARQGGPTERTNAAAEQRSDVGRHKTREIERVFQPLVQRNLTNVVAVIKHRQAHFLEVDHRLHVHFHRCAGGFFDGFGVAFAFLAPFGHCPALGQITVDRIVGRCLICHHIRAHAAFDQFGVNVSRIAE